MSIDFATAQLIFLYIIKFVNMFLIYTVLFAPVL